jgi:ketosteroid isomerase-like protein
MIPQEKEIADPQLRQQLDAKIKNYDDGWNNNDAAALAAFFTDDAVYVTDRGPICGPEAIEEHFTDLFQNVHFSNHIAYADQDSPHIIGTDGNEMWASGGWSPTLEEKMGDPMPLKGYWSEIYVREGDSLKVRMQIWNITPAEAK